MDAEVALEKSETSDTAQSQGKDCTVGEFITTEEGWKIIEIAQSWEGTAYSMVGANSKKGEKGDCSGTTNKIFTEAGFAYPYQTTSNFADYASKSNRFRKIDTSKQSMQVGDILLWPGHMAIYAPFPDGHPRRDTGVMKGGKKQVNNMYTAFNSRTNVPYGPYNIAAFRGDAYTVYRYLKLPCP